MKEFFKYVLATIVGIILTSIIFMVISIVSVAGMVASEGATSSVPKNSVLRIKLEGEIVDRAGEGSPMDFLSQGEQMSIGLDQALDALKKAAKNDKVKGIYLEAGSLAAYPADLQELRRALVEFKESGKWVVAYGDQYSRGAYYLCSVADELFLNPIGMIDWSGMSSQPMFYTGLMKKVGVKMQVFKVGTYKSAVEPFINTSMSEPNREQVTSYLTSIWEGIKKDVSKSRKITVEQLNSLADEYVAMHPASYMVENKLVDKLTYIDEVKEYLKKKMELKEDESLNFITPKEMASSEMPEYKEEDDKIAVYYAVGDIVQTAGSISPMGGTGPQIVGEKVIDDLRALRENKNVKAVVLRVNSGGGSAYASEQIWREVELLKQEKPVVVSMGGLAASGGYYISSGANQIYAEPSTLTGSIGIFGMIPDASELITKKVGIKFDVVKTNALSDMGTMARPMNAEEGHLMQAMIERGYEVFTGRVAMGRKMKLEDVKAIAEGRVWTGEQAKELGLVDKLGNLNDAIKAAAKLAKLEKYNRVNYPEPAPWYQSLLNQKKSGYLEAGLREVLGEYYTTFSLLRTLKNQDRIQARLPFEPNIQ